MAITLLWHHVMRPGWYVYIMFSAATATAAASNFRLGIDYSEFLPTGSLTYVQYGVTTTDGQGNIYVLANGSNNSGENNLSYLIKLSQSHVVYQNLLPFFACCAMAADPAGNVYLLTASQDVVKIAPDGVTIVYTVSMGANVSLTGVAVDSSGRAYVAGFAFANAIQTTPGAYQTAPASTSSGVSNAFVMRFKPNGATDYATYLGGSSPAQTAVIAVDAAGTVFVTGIALSADFPTTAGAYLSASAIPNFSVAPFLAHFSSDGSALLYSTFAAPSGYIGSIALDSADEAEVAIGLNTALVERFNAQGTGVVFHTSLPAASPQALVLDAAGNTYLALSASANFQPMNSLAACGTSATAALTVLDDQGNILQATYIPGIYGSGLFGLGLSSTVYVVGSPNTGFTPTQQSAASSGLVSLTSFAQNPNAAVVQLACVSNAASYDNAGISGGEMVSLFGQELGPAAGTQPQVDASTGFPKQLAGVQVTFNGIPGPLLFVQDSQINAIAPWALAAGSNVQVCAAYNGASTHCATLPVLSAHPGVFTVDGVHAIAFNQDGSLNTAGNPAQAGSTVSVFATGLGPITPAEPDGAIVGPTVPTNVLPDYILWQFDTFFIGSIAETTPVSYAGPAPFQVAGFSQVNFVVQNTTQPLPGQVPFTLQAGGVEPVGLLFGGGADSNGFLVYVAGEQ